MSFIEKIKQTSDSINANKEKVLLTVKQDIERMSQAGCRHSLFYPDTFRQLIAAAIQGVSYADREAVSFDTYHEMLFHVMNALIKEGFKVSTSFGGDEQWVSNVYFHINW